jgi:4-hydroxy-3-methylbut-2-en-1-yl diphosphate synthase IspG/GcpE
MVSFTFKCPTTGLNVAHEIVDGEDVPDNVFEPVICPACTRLHFLNLKTGKLLGQVAD